MNFSAIIPWAVLVLIIFIWIARATAKKRREAFQKIARQRGLTFSARLDVMPDALKDFTRFADRRGGVITNVIRGSAETVDVMLFDHRYLTGKGHSMTGRTQTVAVYRSDRLHLPVFFLYPQGIISRMFRRLDVRSISFAARTAFDDAYSVRGEDEEGIRKIFRDSVFSYLEKKHGLTIEGRADRLLYCRAGVLIKTDELQDFLSEGLKVVKLLQSQK